MPAPDRVLPLGRGPVAALVPARVQDRDAEHAERVDAGDLLVREARERDHHRPGPPLGRVREQARRVTGRDPAEHHRDPGQDVGEVDAVRRRRAERDEPVLEPDPDVRLLERGHDRAREEGQHVFLLELPAERGGHVGVVGLTHDQAEPEDRAVDERIPELPDLGVGDEARVRRPLGAGLGGTVGPDALPGDERVVAGGGVRGPGRVGIGHRGAGHRERDRQVVGGLLVGEGAVERGHRRSERGSARLDGPWNIDHREILPSTSLGYASISWHRTWRTAIVTASDAAGFMGC